MFTNPQSQKSNPFPVRFMLVLVGFMLIAAFFLLGEHKAHFLGFLPYAFFLLCPVLHLFMHSGHGGHGSHSSHESHDSSYGQSANIQQDDKKDVPGGK